MKEIEELRKKLHHTCGCITTSDAYELLDIIEKRIKELEEIEWMYNDL